MLLLKLRDFLLLLLHYQQLHSELELLGEFRDEAVPKLNARMQMMLYQEFGDLEEKESFELLQNKLINLAEENEEELEIKTEKEELKKKLQTELVAHNNFKNRKEVLDFLKQGELAKIHELK